MAEGQETSKTFDGQTRGRRWRRRILIVLVIAALVVSALLGVAPRLLSTPGGIALLERGLSNEQARIEIGDLRLRWTGGQEVRGLRFESAKGEYATNLDLDLEGALWRWITGSRDFGTVRVSGDAELTVGAPSTERAFDFRLPEGFRVRIESEGLTIRVTDVSSESHLGGAADVRDLRGFVEVRTGAPMRLEAEAETLVDSRTGRLHAEGEFYDLVQADGSIRPLAARGTADLQAESLPTGLIDRLGNQKGRLLALLGESFDVVARANVEAQNGEVSLHAESPRAVADARLVITDDDLRLIEPAKIRFTVDDRTLEAWAPKDRAVRVSAAESAEWRLRISSFEAPLPVDGRLDVSGMSFDADLAGSSIMLSVATEESPRIHLAEITAHMSSEDPTDLIRAEMTGTMLEENGSDTASARSEWRLAGLMGPHGKPRLETFVANGDLTLNDLPTRIVDSLVGADGLMADLIGPSIATVTVRTSREAKMLTLELDAEASNFELTTAAVYSGGVLESAPDHPHQLSVRAMGDSERQRLDRIAADRGWKARLVAADPIVLNIDNYRFPLAEIEDPVAEASLSGSLSAKRLAFDLPGADAPVVIDDLDITADTDGLGRAVKSKVTMTLAVDQQSAPVRGEVNVTSPLTTNMRTIEGELHVEGAPTAIFAGVAGERFEALHEALGDDVDFSLLANVTADAGAATITAVGVHTQLNATVEPTEGVYRIGASGRLTVTPQLVEFLRPDDSSWTLTEASALRFTVPPIDMQRPAGDSGWREAITDTPVRVVISADPIFISGAPGLTEPIGFAELEGDVACPAGIAGLIEITGEGAIRTTQEDDHPGVLAFVANVQPGEGGGYDATLALRDATVRPFEKLLGLAPGRLTDWIGAAGAATIELSPASESASEFRIVVNGRFDRFRGRIPGWVNEETIELSHEGEATIAVAREAMTRLLMEEFKSETLAVSEDVELHVDLDRVSLPVAMFRGEPFDPADVSVELTANASTLNVVSVEPIMVISDLALIVGGSSIADGLGYKLTGAVVSEKTDQPGALAISGLTRAATNEWSELRHDFDGEVTGVPVEFADRLANLRGQLIAGLGSTMDATLTLSDASLHSGTLTARIKSPNGWLNIHDASIENEALTVSEAAPIRAMLDVTPLMAETILRNVNPIFYDIRKKRGPLLFEAQTLRLPLDGDLAKLDGRFTIDLGQVDVPSGGIIDELLGTIGDEQSQVTAATIPPVSVRVRNGLLSYDELVLQAERYNIRTGGAVNLVDRTLNLWAAVPLIGWKTVFGDLMKVDMPIMGEISPEIPFYLRITGPIDNPKVEADPNGAKRVADEFFEDTIGNIFDTLFPKSKPSKDK